MPDHKKVQLIMDLRRAGIVDPALLDILETVPREDFLHGPFREQAYENMALPIECGQTISQPFIVGLMTQALEPEARSRVLEIGTGSGYQTVVLARLVRWVYTMERYRTLQRQAHDRFKAMGLHNIVTRVADGSKGWPDQAPFDRIMVTAGAAQIPEALYDQLKPDGIMVIPVGRESETQKLLKVIRRAAGPELIELAEVRFVPLVEGQGILP